MKKKFWDFARIEPGSLRYQVENEPTRLWAPQTTRNYMLYIFIFVIVKQTAPSLIQSFVLRYNRKSDFYGHFYWVFLNVKIILA